LVAGKQEGDDRELRYARRWLLKTSEPNGGAGLDVEAMGKAGLSGVPAKVAEKASTPIASRTRLTQGQVEAIIGAISLGLAIWQFVRLIRRVVHAGRTGEVER
jgi:hypothetical protein